jgi:hypothetical protein
MGIVRQHLRGHVSGDCHDRAVTGKRFCKLGDRLVPQIVKAQPSQRTLYFLEISLALRVPARF